MLNFEYDYNKNPYYYAFEVWKFFFEQKKIKVDYSVHKHFTARFISRFNPQNSTDFFNFLESLEKPILNVQKNITKSTKIKMMLKSGASLIFEIKPWQNGLNLVSLITIY